MRAQKPKCTVECLSARYLHVDPDAVQALADLIAANASLECVYLHLSDFNDNDKQAIATAWKARGHLHRITNNGLTLQRKIDLAYLNEKARLVPQWALEPPPKPKATKKKGKGKGKKKK